MENFSLIAEGKQGIIARIVHQESMLVLESYARTKQWKDTGKRVVMFCILEKMRNVFYNKGNGSFNTVNYILCHNKKYIYLNIATFLLSYNYIC